MTSCQRPGCTGAIEDGYCNVCGMAPATRRPASMPSSPVSSARATSSTQGTRPTGSRGTSRSGSTRSSGRGNLGAGLVEVPPVPYRDPASVVLVDAEVPERKRFCSSCGHPVGRGRDGQPGRTEGFCTKCRTRYSFTPKLAPHDLVDGKYEVVGPIAHGGLGWVYLAVDHSVSDRWVVLKGLLDAGDESAMAAAIAERQFLAQVDHPSIVKIHSFVEHDGSGYIVMEYVGGQSLKELRQPSGGTAAPLPLTRAIAYVLEILPAFGYLHRQGLLYCDFKPDNVIQSEEQLKLIDLGGVRRIDDDVSDLYGTIGYQAPEVPAQGATISSDLYTVARTLAVMSFDFRGMQDEARFATSLPARSDVDVFRDYESFWWFMTKATDADPAARFESADEMADQLTGILREIIATDGGRPPPATSSQFTAELQADPDRPEWRTLPLPTVDPLDPGATILASLATAQAGHLVTALQTAPPSPEILFSLVRAHLELGDLAAAGEALTRIDAEVGDDWRAVWWHGVAEMAADHDGAARDRFAGLARALPGELAPKLALASACERLAVGTDGDPDDLLRAARYYETVARTDPSYASASFGLARVRLALGEREAAAEALRRIPASSSSWSAARIGLCRALSRDVDGQSPAVEDLVAASDTLEALTADPAVRAALTRDVLKAGLHLVDTGAVPTGQPIRIVGAPLVESDLRTSLERAYRAMAKLASSDAERIDLIDQANQSRPRSLL